MSIDTHYDHLKFWHNFATFLHVIQLFFLSDIKITDIHKALMLLNFYDIINIIYMWKDTFTRHE